MSHKAIAYAQILLTLAFIVGYFVVLWGFMQGKVHVPVEFKDAFTALLGVITASVVQVMSYWFARQRQSVDPGQ